MAPAHEPRLASVAAIVADSAPIGIVISLHSAG